ncbi:MAG TPA: hypothetical protein VGY76_09280 [Solirubrobacteraceae bacterium]|jgi:hypothetical protein|nr:hypothetical protein [Solirubrobacteraceae bacterium]
MDDIPAEETNHIDSRGLSGVSAAHFATGSSNWNGIRANLAEMERKLGELQQQVDPAQRRGEALHHEIPHDGGPHLAALAGQAYPDALPVPSLPDFATTPAAHAQVAQAKQQIEDLLRVREMLRDSLRGTIGECERMLGQLDRGEPVSPALGASGSGETLAGSAPAGIALRPSVFQGSVSLRVGPLNDISQVDTLEIALLQVPGAEQVEVKEFSGRDAVAEIRLFQPVRLVEELHRVLPFSFEVTHGDASSLTLLAGSEAIAAGVASETPTVTS